MRTNQKEREAFLLRMQAEGVPPEVARRVLRDAATLKRLFVAESNAEYPYNLHTDCKLPDCRCYKGPVGRCGNCTNFLPLGALAPGSHHCSACRAWIRLHDALSRYDIKAVQSDLNVRLHVPSKTDEGWGGVNVPA